MSIVTVFVYHYKTKWSVILNIAITYFYAVSYTHLKELEIRLSDKDHSYALFGNKDETYKFFLSYVKMCIRDRADGES